MDVGMGRNAFYKITSRYNDITLLQKIMENDLWISV